jgi:hypothetical protein
MRTETILKSPFLRRKRSRVQDGSKLRRRDQLVLRLRQGHP